MPVNAVSHFEALYLQRCERTDKQQNWN